MNFFIKKTKALLQGMALEPFWIATVCGATSGVSCLNNLFRRLDVASRMSVLRESPEAIVDLQEGAIAKLLSQAAQVPYWQLVFKNISTTRKSLFAEKFFFEIPLLKKEILQESFPSFTNPHFAKKAFIMSTSGSSGRPVKFLVDRKLFFRRAWALHVVFSYYGIPLNAHITRLSYRDFPWADFQGLYEPPTLNFLEKKAVSLPNNYVRVLYGTVSHVRMAAEACEARGITRRFDFVITRSEHISENMRSYYARIFGARVYNVYAAREFGPMAVECREGIGFHVLDDSIFLEVLGTDNKPTKEFGKIVITSLLNRSLPFIRYDIGDRGRIIQSKCTCEMGVRTILLQGRESDFLYFSHQKMPVSDFFKPLSLIGNIRAFQFIQKEVNSFVVRLILSQSTESDLYSHKIRDLLSRFVYEQSMERPDIYIEIVNDFPILPNGKRRLLISDIKDSVFS